jgi:hypothetical protein
MLVDSRCEIGGDARVHRATIAVCHDMDPTALYLPIHASGCEEAGPRVKPGAT